MSLGAPGGKVSSKVGYRPSVSVEHAEPFRHSRLAVEGEIDVLLKIFIVHAKAFLCLSPSAEECEHRGSKFSVVGHNFVLSTHCVEVRCWDHKGSGAGRKGETCRAVADAGRWGSKLHP